MDNKISMAPHSVTLTIWHPLTDKAQIISEFRGDVLSEVIERAAQAGYDSGRPFSVTWGARGLFSGRPSNAAQWAAMAPETKSETIWNRIIESEE